MPTCMTHFDEVPLVVMVNNQGVWLDRSTGCRVDSLNSGYFTRQSRVR